MAVQTGNTFPVYFKVVGGEDGKPLVEVEVDGKAKQFHPEEVRRRPPTHHPLTPTTRKFTCNSPARHRATAGQRDGTGEDEGDGRSLPWAPGHRCRHHRPCLLQRLAAPGNSSYVCNPAAAWALQSSSIQRAILGQLMMQYINSNAELN